MQSASNQTRLPHLCSVSRKGVPQPVQTGAVSMGSFFHRLDDK
jgi:hypothetical protein